MNDKEFLDFVDKTICWYRVHATPNQYLYNIIRTALILVGVTLPFLTTQKWYLAASVASISMAAMSGLDSLLKPGDLWRQHRSAQLGLMHLRRDYLRARSQIPEGDAPGHNALFNDFFSKVEGLLSREAEEFWQMRVTPIQKAELSKASSDAPA